MPNYDYHCAACGRTSEIFQSISAPHLTNCPHCKSTQFARQIGGGAILSKAASVYATGGAQKPSGGGCGCGHGGCGHR